MSVKRKILIVGTDREGAIESYYKESFIHHGWEILFFDSRPSLSPNNLDSIFTRVRNRINAKSFLAKVNMELLKFTERVRPEVILVFKGLELYPETIEELGSYAKIVSNYNPDHPFEHFSAGSGNNNVYKSLALYDVHFSYSRNITDKFKNELSKEAFWIPFGYDASKSNKRSLAESVYKDSFVFIGAWDKERSGIFNNIEVNNLKIYGDDRWKSRNLFNPQVRGMFQHKRLYNEDFTDAIANSMGSINLLRKQNMLEDSHNMRTFEATGYGGVMISQRTSEQLSFFEEDKEAIYFDDVAELNDKLSYLSSHPDMIQKIKDSAVERVRKSEYSYLARGGEMSRIFNRFI